MLAEELPVAWRVRAVTPSGVVHAERVFHLRQSPLAQTAAKGHAHALASMYPACRVEIAPLTPEQG